LTEQNELLHQQLQTLGSQAARIRQVASANVVGVENASGESEGVDQQLADLRSVISYLRKEKEISELHLEVSKQEAARSKAEVDHLARILEETRALLTEVMRTTNRSFLKLTKFRRNVTVLLRLRHQPRNMLN
jgi:nucleoprotein TPR